MMSWSKNSVWSKGLIVYIFFCTSTDWWQKQFDEREPTQFIEQIGDNDFMEGEQTGFSETNIPHVTEIQRYQSRLQDSRKSILDRNGKL